MFVGLLLVNVLLFGFKIILSRQVSYRKSFLDAPLLVLLVSSFLSTVFSANMGHSFFGRNQYFILSFAFLFFLAVFYIMIVNLVKSNKGWRGVLDILVLVGGITGFIFILRMIFGVDLLGSLFGTQVWNTIDGINSIFGLWMVVIFVLSAGQIIRSSLDVGRTLVNFLIMIISFVVLVLLSFNVLWWLLLLGISLLLLLGINFIKEARLGWISALFVTLILVVIFIVFGSPKSLQSAVPAEIALGFSPSWSITTDTVLSGVKNFVLGSGLGTFGVDFSQFRPESFNYDNMAWSLRFTQPISTLFAILAEGGVLMLLVLIFLVLFFLGHVFHFWLKNRLKFGHNFMTSKQLEGEVDLRLEVFLVVASWFILTVAMTVMFFGPVMWWLWFLLLALGTIGLSLLEKGVIEEKKWAIEETPQYSLSFSFVMIVVMAAVVMFGVWGTKLYLADLAYAKALRAPDTQTAEQYINQALSHREGFDLYHSGLAQVYLSQAVELSKQSEPDLNIMSDLIAKAVNEAKRATDLSPKSVALWENLSTMYENATALVPETREWAIKSLVKARDLEPSNPVLHWRLANNYSVNGNWEEAVKSYKKATELKTDYFGAYIGLANSYDQNGQTDEAVSTYEKIIQVAQDNPDILFSYGRLLYNRGQSGDRDRAEELWLRVVELNGQHSNALYSLGLLYEGEGNRNRALQYYYKVKDLNPGNQDITIKIRNLVGPDTSE